MTIEKIQEKITAIKQKMDSWPMPIHGVEEKEEVLAQTDAHFTMLESDLGALLEQCKMLPVSDQDSISPYLRDLRDFVQDKFQNTEKELIQLKSQMDTGRSHAQAIKAYSKY